MWINVGTLSSIRLYMQTAMDQARASFYKQNNESIKKKRTFSCRQGYKAYNQLQTLKEGKR